MKITKWLLQIFFTFSFLTFSFQVNSQNDNLYVDNENMEECGYYFTPIAALCCGCTQVQVTALRTYIPYDNNVTFTRTQLTNELGCSYKYIGGMVEGYNGNLTAFCTSVSDREEEDNTGSCTGLEPLIIYHDNFHVPNTGEVNIYN